MRDKRRFFLDMCRDAPLPASFVRYDRFLVGAARTRRAGKVVFAPAAKCPERNREARQDLDPAFPETCKAVDTGKQLSLLAHTKGFVRFRSILPVGFLGHGTTNHIHDTTHL
jgi:hypothetical protein